MFEGSFNISSPDLEPCGFIIETSKGPCSHTWLAESRDEFEFRDSAGATTCCGLKPRLVSLLFCRWAGAPKGVCVLTYYPQFLGFGDDQSV